jgi:phage shock protein C
MYCTKCGVELRDDDNFCSKCGVRTANGFTATAPLQSRSLMLDKANKKVSGVCAGFARYFDVDVILMRVLWLTISLCTGVGFIAYIVAATVMPSDQGYRAPAQLVRV